MIKAILCATADFSELILNYVSKLALYQHECQFTEVLTSNRYLMQCHTNAAVKPKYLHWLLKEIMHQDLIFRTR